MFTFICERCAVWLWLLSGWQFSLLSFGLYHFYNELNIAGGPIFKNLSTLDLSVQLTTFGLVLVNLHLHLRQAFRGSYGYQSKCVGLLLVVLSGILSFGYFVYFLFYSIFESTYSVSSIYTLIGCASFFLLWFMYCVQYYKIYEYVDSLVKTNNDNGIPLDEQSARELYRIRECERLFLCSADSGPAFCYGGGSPLEYAEFHFLMRVVDAVDRIGLKPHDPRPIRELGDEIRARCARFNLSNEEKRRYQSLAANFPRIVEPPVVEDPYYEYDRRVAANSYCASQKSNNWSGSKLTLL